MVQQEGQAGPSTDRLQIPQQHLREEAFLPHIFKRKKGLPAVNITMLTLCLKRDFPPVFKEFEISTEGIQILFLPYRSPHTPDGIRTRKQLGRLLPSVL